MELAKRMVMASMVTLVNLNMVLSQITLSRIAELSSHLFSSAFFLSLTASLPLIEKISDIILQLATLGHNFPPYFLVATHWVSKKYRASFSKQHQTSTIGKRGIYLQTQAWSESSGLSEVFGRTPFQSPQKFRSLTIFGLPCLPIFLRASQRHCGLERRRFQGLVRRCWWSRCFSNAPSWSAIPRPWTPCLGPWTLSRPCLGPWRPWSRPPPTSPHSPEEVGPARSGLCLRKIGDVFQILYFILIFCGYGIWQRWELYPCIMCICVYLHLHVCPIRNKISPGHEARPQSVKAACK